MFDRILSKPLIFMWQSNTGNTEAVNVTKIFRKRNFDIFYQLQYVNNIYHLAVTGMIHRYMYFLQTLIVSFKTRSTWDCWRLFFGNVSTFITCYEVRTARNFSGQRNFLGIRALPQLFYLQHTK